MTTSGTYNEEKELSTNLDEGITSSDESILISDISPLADDKDLVNREVLKRLIDILEEKSVGEIVNNGEEVIIKDLAGNIKKSLKVHKRVSYQDRKPNMPMYGEEALKDADCALFSTDTQGNRYLVKPITRENCVEGLGRLRDTAYSVGDIALCAGSQSLQLICTASGTTSSDDLDISSNQIGDSITDGTVTWVVVNRNYLGSDGVLPIANGGTGANNAIEACANLGALPLSGGTMTGCLELNTIIPYSEPTELSIGGADSTKEIRLFASNNVYNSSGVIFSSKNTNGYKDESLRGYFSLQTAASKDTDTRDLVGKTDGTLTWCGKNVATQGALSMPGRDTVSINYTISDDGYWSTPYTAPADGWINFMGTSCTSLEIQVNHYTQYNALAGVKGSQGLTVPIAKGQVVQVHISSAATVYRYVFIYAQSEV